jgi:hypothetical protein
VPAPFERLSRSARWVVARHRGRGAAWTGPALLAGSASGCGGSGSRRTATATANGPGSRASGGIRAARRVAAPGLEGGSNGVVGGRAAPGPWRRLDGTGSTRRGIRLGVRRMWIAAHGYGNGERPRVTRVGGDPRGAASGRAGFGGWLERRGGWRWSRGTGAVAPLGRDRLCSRDPPRGAAEVDRGARLRQRRTAQGHARRGGSAPRGEWPRRAWRVARTAWWVAVVARHRGRGAAWTGPALLAGSASGCGGSGSRRTATATANGPGSRASGGEIRSARRVAAPGLEAVARTAWWVVARHRGRGAAWTGPALPAGSVSGCGGSGSRRTATATANGPGSRASGEIRSARRGEWPRRVWRVALRSGSSWDRDG